MPTESDWAITETIQPFLWSGLFVFVCLAIVSFPSHLNRWTAISVLVVPVYGAFKTSDKLSPDDVFNDIYLRFVIIVSSHIVALCFKGTSPSNGSQTKPTSSASAWIKGYKLVFNTRGVGTSWELPYLWPNQKTTELARLPNEKEKDKESTASSRPTLPSRGYWSALSIRFGYLVLNFVLICCYYDFLDPAALLAINDADFSIEKESIIRRFLQQYTGKPPTTPITQREFVVRAWQAIDNFVPDYLMLSAYHDFFAIIFIGVGLDQSWEWPPLFGRISDAYTMRRFWSLFWHRLVYKSYSFHAAAISTRLGIKQGTVFSRIFNNFMVFVLSAIMHATVIWKFGSKCAWGRSMVYWVMQPLAFVLEGIVQFYWGKFKRSRLSKVRPSVLSIFERVIGYAWVMSWLVWESPKRIFALRNCNSI